MTAEPPSSSSPGQAAEPTPDRPGLPSATLPNASPSPPLQAQLEAIASSYALPVACQAALRAAIQEELRRVELGRSLSPSPPRDDLGPDNLWAHRENHAQAPTALDPASPRAPLPAHASPAPVGRAGDTLPSGTAESTLLTASHPVDPSSPTPPGAADASAPSVSPCTPTDREPPFPSSLLGRYQDLGPLGVGGMGEVRRVRDLELNRTMAIKIVHPRIMSYPDALARFVEEAQATAQLQHPGIVPVHEQGRLPDGRLYFTMKEVEGETLSSAIALVHAASQSSWQPASSPESGQTWTFRRLLEAFRKVVETMAFAHSRGVTHRDLKPSNIMLGAYGEVLVLDWGLAKVRTGSLEPTPLPPHVAEQAMASEDASPGAVTLISPGMEVEWPPDGAQEGPRAIRTGTLTGAATQAGSVSPAGAHHRSVATWSPELTPGRVPPPQIVTARSQEGALATRMGTVAGTPAYMPPEQARGEVDRVGPASDVYALGAILYHVLAGRPPYSGPDHLAVLQQVLSGPPMPPGSAPLAVPSVAETLFGDDPLPGEPTSPMSSSSLSPPLPPELVAICQKAMARAPTDRYAHAGELAEAIGAWLEGSLKREQALKHVLAADTLQPEILDLRAQAARLKEQARLELAPLLPYEPVARKRVAWELEDEAVRLERLADLQEVEYVQLLQSALTHLDDLPEAHTRLADHYQRLHAAAEGARRESEAAQLEALLRLHDRGKHAAWLKGDGQLTLVTDPPGATLELYRFELQDRRLVARPVQGLGRSPLERCELPMGSYVVKIRARGRATVHYPFQLSRQARWTGVRPGSDRPTPIFLPPLSRLTPQDCVVPAGWFTSGGDPEAFNATASRTCWVDGFVMRRYPVTHAEYLAFLNDLLAQGLEGEALRHVPRLKSSHRGDEGALFYSRKPDGGFELLAEDRGVPFRVDEPALLVPWTGALAYARWEAQRTGLPWRLPAELEWEKAARGVDGRFYPWGDFADPSQTCVLESWPDEPRPVSVDSYPDDVSLYGIRGLAGNVRDWCCDLYRKEGPLVENGCVVVREADQDDPRAPRALRGGACALRLVNARSAARYWDSGTIRSFLIGFRLAYSLK